MSCSGFFLVDKPEGPTSNRVLQGIKRGYGKARSFAEVKFGHAGTLDSFASGLLIVLVGSCTRLTPWFMHQTKEYLATFRFGAETDTLDPLGRVIGHKKPPGRDALESALPRFEGHILQVPPSYSAVHVGGKRSYKIAQNGQTPGLAPRSVVIEALKMHSYDSEEARFTISCSSGTYIRALARDIAQACGSSAFVKSLRRTRIGPFSVSAAAPPDRCSTGTILHFVPEVAISLGLRAGFLKPTYYDRFMHGSELPFSAIDFDNDSSNPSEDRSRADSALALFSQSNSFLGIAQTSQSGWAVKVMAADGAEI